jgi:hypothetical protein
MNFWIKTTLFLFCWIDFTQAKPAKLWVEKELKDVSTTPLVIFQHQQTGTMANLRKQLRPLKAGEKISQKFQQLCKKMNHNCHQNYVQENVSSKGIQTSTYHFLKKRKSGKRASYYHYYLTLSNSARLSKKDIESLIQLAQKRINQ